MAHIIEFVKETKVNAKTYKVGDKLKVSTSIFNNLTKDGYAKKYEKTAVQEEVKVEPVKQVTQVAQSQKVKTNKKDK